MRSPVYMLGVAGMGMAPLAICLVQSGIRVIGFDDNMPQRVRALLEGSGVEIENYPRRDLVGIEEIVYSSAFQKSYPFIQKAEKLGVPCFRRGERLSKLVKNKKLLAVCGSHGKTTCTAMIVHMLKFHNIDFSWFIGGLWNAEKTDELPGHWSDESEWVVAEIDESDGTINEFSPELLLVLNLDFDHSAHYENLEVLRSTFAALIARTQGACLIDEDARNWLPHEISCEIETFTVPRLEDGFEKSDFRQVNAAIARRAAKRVSGQEIHFELESFPGISRRNNCLFEDGNLTIIEDYAHHPVEISAFFKLHAPDSETVVVFQPHRFSRTEQFKREFADALEVCENLVILPVYAASEVPESENTNETFFQTITQANPAASFCEEVESLNKHLHECIISGCRKVIFLGAGDVEHWARAFMYYYQAREKSSWLSYVKSGLSDTKIIHEDYNISTKTTLRVGGNAKFYVEPESLADLLWVIQVSRFYKYPTFMLGRGSNLIISDKGYKGVVIRLNKGEWSEIRKLDDHRLFVGSGVRLKELCGKAAQWEMAGFEFLEGIPGSVGGSLRMNAGAMGNWIFDVVESVYFINGSGKLSVMDKMQFHVEYRKCKEIAEGIALGAVFKAMSREDSQTITTKMNDFSSQRKSTQPKEPSAGCIFKNPENGHAGKLVDENGLKGKRIGDAEVSMTHGNFIINKGNASSEDVLSLVKEVRDEIQCKTGISLETEVLLLGEEWDTVLR